MYTGRITSNVNIGGVAMSGTVEREAETVLPTKTILPAGVAGAISAAGVDGLATGHGFTALDVIDVHWLDPSTGARKSRRGITLDDSAANAVEFDNDPAAEGDALPAEDTAVVIAMQVTISGVTFEGDALKILGVKATKNAVADFRDSGGSELVLTLTAEEAYLWAIDHSGANPVAGDTIATIVASNASTTATTLSIAALLDTVG